ncbi:MAG: transcription-repair coupling factor [Clostridiaceae bacterium]|nr:transcription-repair coupling factor [Clostridiaceae bacterium]
MDGQRLSNNPFIEPGKIIPDCIESARKDAALESVVTSLCERVGSHINISGMPDSLKAFVLLSVASRTGKRPVLIVSDELRARIFQADLSAFTGQDIPVLRQREQSLAEVDASSKDIEYSRISALRRLVTNNYPALIVTSGALSSRLMPMKTFEESLITLRIGMHVSPEDLAMRLTGVGYERVRQVEGQGEFARRGEIFDIFPVGMDFPVRISFFDDEIDQIKTFELKSQRSMDVLKNISVDIAREMSISPSSRQFIASEIMIEAERAKTSAARNGADRSVCETIYRACSHDAERIEDGMYFHGMEKWISLLYPNSESTINYIHSSGALLFVDEMIQVKKRIDGTRAEFMQRYASMFERGLVTGFSENMLINSPEIMIDIDRCGRVVTLSNLRTSGNGLPRAKDVSIQGRAADSFRGHEARLSEQIISRSKDGLNTVLWTGSGTRSDKLRAFLSSMGAFPQYVSEPLPSGFEYPAADILFVGAQDIFGVDRPIRKKKSQGVRIDLFSDLIPGELVVHDHHGIGRYDGLVNLETGGVKRDYLKITYASDDSLYIPMDSLDAIQKYVGSEGRHPKLSRLGGQDWNRMKERARTSIRALAVDLVALYAERQQLKGHPFTTDTVWQKQFEEDFPYAETPDQLDAIKDIKTDMESDRIMDRLLCGDVGFGKTEVAFRAIFKCVMDGKQAIMLAPTTVLVQQHFENLRERLKDYPVKIGLLSRFAGDAMIKETVKGLNNGSVDIVVGTHRVLSKDIIPKRLGLLVVDEEQRFGVEHKERLKSLRSTVDVLTLTATPIPRTLHMSLSGIRDISVLEDPPLDRRPVQTYVMEYDNDVLAEACLREISRQGQVFYLFNDTHRIQDKAIELEKALPGARILIGHGKMSEHRLEQVIESFIRHEADILVCTTIIESGIDMPNVNTIIVENADRFGLAQLYQLRGRVGRSDRQAYAYITYQRDKVLTEEAEKRLAAIRDYTELGSGIKIALKDLEVRGAGNLLGGEQHGQMDVIGYELYCRMLDEEIKSLQGIKVEQEPDVIVEMEEDAYIPSSFIADEGQRMDAYRKIAAVSNQQAYMDIQDELEDRFGELPKQVLVLADIAYIRHMAARYGFEKVSVKRDAVYFYYKPNAKTDMEALSRVLGHPIFAGKIMLSAMSKPYIQYKPSEKDRVKITSRIREFFLLSEGLESESE